jgi:hypothetical protein
MPARIAFGKVGQADTTASKAGGVSARYDD